MHMKVIPKALYSQTYSHSTQEGIYNCSILPQSPITIPPVTFLSFPWTEMFLFLALIPELCHLPKSPSPLLFLSPLPSDTPVAVLSAPVLCECGIMRLRMELWWSDAGLNWSGRCAWLQPVIFDSMSRAQSTDTGPGWWKDVNIIL